MAGVKKPLSYLDLDRANPTATLFEKLFRDSVDYKKEIDDVFEAIVLTDPTLATKDAESALKNQLFTIPAENPNSRTTYIFIARIIGRDSPHLFLPDPLEFNVTNDEECKKRYHNLLQLHTKVTANGLSVSEMPAKGDTIQIRLVKGDYVYKTAFCNDFLGVTVKASSTPEVAEKLKKNEEGAKGAFKKNKPINVGAKDDPTFQKCRNSNYPTLNKRETKFFKPSLQEKQVAATIASAGDSNLYSAMLAIISKEQPNSMPNYNPSGIQLDNRGTFRGIKQNDFDYQTCFRDNGGDQRIFAGFNSLENGMKVFAKILKNKGLPASTGDISVDSSNLSDWYFQNWNLALTDAELKQLKDKGFATRNGTQYKRDWAGTRKTFEKQLSYYNSSAVAESFSGDTGL
jgi:hypothetical protein